MPENEDLKDQIKTRADELIEGRERTPLVEFTGKFIEYIVNPPDEWKRVFVNLHFTDVEVKQSSSAYAFPTADVAIKYSQAKRSGWGFFLRSFGEVTEEEATERLIGFTPHPVLAEDLNELIGCDLHLHKRFHDYGLNPDTQEPMVGEVWMVFGVEGDRAKRVDPHQRVLEILDGKTHAEFNTAALQDSSIKADATLSTNILKNTLLPSLLQQGKVSVDEDGIYHVVVG